MRWGWGGRGAKERIFTNQKDEGGKRTYDRQTYLIVLQLGREQQRDQEFWIDHEPDLLLETPLHGNSAWRASIENTEAPTKPRTPPPIILLAKSTASVKAVTVYFNPCRVG
jgi:hypothetical protein